MTGKEAFEDYKQLYVAKQFKDGDCGIQKMYEEIINDKFDELTKYKRAFEILKEKFEIELDYGFPDSDYNDMPISGDMEYTLNGEIQITKEEYELLEELLKNEN